MITSAPAILTVHSLHQQLWRKNCDVSMYAFFLRLCVRLCERDTSTRGLDRSVRCSRRKAGANSLSWIGCRLQCAPAFCSLSCCLGSQGMGNASWDSLLTQEPDLMKFRDKWKLLNAKLMCYRQRDFSFEHSSMAGVPRIGSTWKIRSRM